MSRKRNHYKVDPRNNGHYKTNHRDSKLVDYDKTDWGHYVTKIDESDLKPLGRKAPKTEVMKNTPDHPDDGKENNSTVVKGYETSIFALIAAIIIYMLYKSSIQF